MTAGNGEKLRVLVLGASGMMGNTILRVFAESPGFAVTGTVRSDAARARLPESVRDRLVVDIDAGDLAAVARLIEGVRPEIVINCIGIVKQLPAAGDPLPALSINSLWPHQLARLCGEAHARLIQLGTDCVFDGKGSLYHETDFASADDLYGRTKFLGEVDYPHAITLRTSTIGHERGSHHGLLEWFLAQQGEVRGFRRAIFSGLPTLAFAKTIRDFVVPHPELHGLYHVSAEPIAKFDLLALIASVYDKDIRILPDDTLAVDRSLDSSRFRGATGFQPPPWPEMVGDMRRFG